MLWSARGHDRGQAIAPESLKAEPWRTEKNTARPVSCDIQRQSLKANVVPISHSRGAC